MESGIDRRGPRQHLAQGCVIGGVLCGGAAMVTLWYVMKYWTDCGSGIFAGAVVIFVWPVLTLLNGMVFTLTFAVSRTMVGWPAALVTAALALAVVTVVVTDVSFYVVTPINFPPWDIDGYATSEADITRCVAQVIGAGGAVGL
jgi:hypothetical protein